VVPVQPQDMDATVEVFEVLGSLMAEGEIGQMED
jgi:hypothetical protein